MGSAFSFLTSYVQSRTNESEPNESEPNVNAFRNDENVNTQQNDSENFIRTQDGVRCSDSELNSADQNREKAAIESVNGATYNLQIQFRDSTGNVLIGDNNNIDFQPSGKDMGSITEVDAPPMDMTNRTTAPVDVKTQISTTAPVAYIDITANNVIVGDRNEIKMPSRSDRVSTYDSLMRHRRPNDTTDFSQMNGKTECYRRLYSTPYRLPSPGVAPQLKEVFEQMAKIVDTLYPLRDKGEWNEFDKKLNLLQSEYESQPEIKCFLMLERCVRLTYQKRLEEARKIADDVLQIVTNELYGLSREILGLFTNIALASIFRREGEEGKKLGSASECLENAKQSGESLRGINLTIPKFALALLNYEQGRLWSEFAKMTLNPKSAKAEARKFLGFSIDRCRELSNENRLYTARQGFALLDLACLSVPNLRASKKSSVTQTRRYLDEFSRSHNQVEDTPVAAKIKYLMMESKLCMLEENYSSAEEHAGKALNKAKQYKFELEIGPAQDQIDRICVSSASQAKLQVKNIAGRYAYNSTTTTDSDQSASRSD